MEANWLEKFGIALSFGDGPFVGDVPGTLLRTEYFGGYYMYGIEFHRFGQ
jgi:hypothetical protein